MEWTLGTRECSGWFGDWGLLSIVFGLGYFYTLYALGMGILKDMQRSDRKRVKATNGEESKMVPLERIIS